MKSLLALVLLVGVAYADKFPVSGPCEDIDACEKACKANKKGTCYWGGVLALQNVVDEVSLARALAMFDKACAKGDGESCWQSANLIWQQESKEKGDGSKARAAFQKACNKNHARACIRLGQITAASSDAKVQKLAAPAKAKGAKLLEPKCTKAKLVSACSWLASIYDSGDGVTADAKKAQMFREKRCQIETGAACPPPPPPPPPPQNKTKVMTKRADME